MPTLTDGQALARSLFDDFDGEAFNARLQMMRRLFDRYRTERDTMPEELRELAAWLIKQDARQNGRTVQHEAFALHFRDGLTLRHIARKCYCSVRTVQNWNNETLLRLLVILFGVDGIEWK